MRQQNCILIGMQLSDVGQDQNRSQWPTIPKHSHFLHLVKINAKR